MWTVDPNTGNFINGATVHPAPVLTLQRQAAILKTIEEEAKIVPALLLMRGTIQNEAAVIPYLKQYGVTLLKYDDMVASA